MGYTQKQLEMFDRIYDSWSGYVVSMQYIEQTGNAVVTACRMDKKNRMSYSTWELNKSGESLTELTDTARFLASQQAETFMAINS